MKFASVYFRIVAITTLLLGLSLIIFPGFTSGIFFSGLNDDTLFFVTICGSTLLGYSALNWFTAQLNQRETYEIAAWGNLVTLVIATLLSIRAIPDFDQNIWLLTVQHALFATGFFVTLHKLK
jgi:hypothetical protein